MHDAAKHLPTLTILAAWAAPIPANPRPGPNGNQDSAPLSCIRTCIKDLDSPENPFAGRKIPHPSTESTSLADWFLFRGLPAEPAPCYRASQHYLSCLRA